MKLQPREYQQTAVDKTWSYLCTSREGAPLIVLPTGAGKSWVIALLVQKAREIDGRVFVLAHRKELLTQNHEKIQSLLDDPVGIYSAGLKQRDVTEDVVVAGIQSAWKRTDDFGKRDLIIVDEAHLISSGEETMYQTLIQAFPNSRLVGLTATPYRTGEGSIAGPESQFHKISHEVTVAPLVEAGYLSRLTTEVTTQVDVSDLAIRGGEYVPAAMEACFDDQATVDAACREIAQFIGDRKSVLVFCSGVRHAEHVRDVLSVLLQEPVGCVTGNTFSMERMELLNRFRSGSLRVMTNCDVLTTGFDSPRIDCVSVLRATLSPGLFCQMVGRGLRVHPGKESCLVLDFGGNLQRHGSIDSPQYGYSSPKGSDEVPEKNTRGILCLNCGGTMIKRTCIDCGLQLPDLPVPVRHGAHADTRSPLLDPTGEMEVTSFWCGRHTKRAAPQAPPTLRVMYGIRPIDAVGDLTEASVSEWVCFEHQGFARQKAVEWWKKRSLHPVPNTVYEAVELINRHTCRTPSKITVDYDGDWKRIAWVSFSDDRPASTEWHDPVEHVATDEGWGDEVPF